MNPWLKIVCCNKLLEAIECIKEGATWHAKELIETALVMLDTKEED